MRDAPIILIKAFFLGLLLASAGILIAELVASHNRSVSENRVTLPSKALDAIERVSRGNTLKVYPYSVVPGGVHSFAEAVIAERDPVVHAHYAVLGELTEGAYKQPIRRYVSFRKGNKIYWTRHMLTLPAGEPLLINLDDAGGGIRQRCGNRLSMAEQQPQLSEAEDAKVEAAMEVPDIQPDIQPLPEGFPDVFAVPDVVIPQQYSAEISAKKDFSAGQNAALLAPAAFGFGGIGGGFGGGSHTTTTTVILEKCPTCCVSPVVQHAGVPEPSSTWAMLVVFAVGFYGLRKGITRKG